MHFSCEKCDKIFERKEHLERHNTRKLPCNRETLCNRCGKDFNQASDLIRHLNKKYKCQDNRNMKELDLRIEETKLQV